jgi:alpha-aminoadipate carrier protein LysW
MDRGEIFNKNSTRSPKTKIRARCPSCGTQVDLRDNIEVWDLVDCPKCNTLLEVIDLRPPTLDYASDDLEDKDWGDENWNDI